MHSSDNRWDIKEFFSGHCQQFIKNLITREVFCEVFSLAPDVTKSKLLRESFCMSLDLYIMQENAQKNPISLSRKNILTGRYFDVLSTQFPNRTLPNKALIILMINIFITNFISWKE
jgi:hypothetical protein